MKFIFDVDGTLTPSRQLIDPKFGEWFLDFIETHDVALASGSDYIKTLEQLGPAICEGVDAVYSSSGNDIWEHGENTYRSDWIIPGKLEVFLFRLLEACKYPVRTGNHIERRPGAVNFSIVGRNANYKERQSYIQWDITNNERKELAELIEKNFPNLSAVAGGETGIDISPKGCDKGQIINHYLWSDYIIFVGDRMDPGGNDYPLAQNNKNGKNIFVQNWEETWEYLLTLLS